MPDRPMTPDEMQDFEQNVLHHEDEETTAAAPASEPEVAKRLERDSDTTTVVPNPD